MSYKTVIYPNGKYGTVRYVNGRPTNGVYGMSLMKAIKTTWKKNTELKRLRDKF